jgi:hypothetical protein
VQWLQMGTITPSENCIYLISLDFAAFFLTKARRSEQTFMCGWWRESSVSCKRTQATTQKNVQWETSLHLLPFEARLYSALAFFNLSSFLPKLFTTCN